MYIVLDIETNLSHDTIWMCVTRNINTDETIVWKTFTGLQEYLSKAEKIIGHNVIGFDFPVLKKVWNIQVKKLQVIDTLVMSRLYSPSMEGGHSLESWGNRLGFHKLEFTDFDSGASVEM